MRDPIYGYATRLKGAWQGEGAEHFETVDPAAPETVVGRYTVSTLSEIGRVIEAARGAQREWARVPGLERQELINAYIAKLRSRSDALAEAITREMGKPLADARGEVAYSLIEAEFMAGEAARPIGQVLPSRRRDFRNLVLRRPRGVIAAVTPWNYPVLTPLRKIVPALVFGNAIVLKPSEFTPAAACIAADLAHGILPDGLFGIVLGQADTGRALVSHADINAVTFTGSVATGRAVYELAAKSLAEVSLELGGKNPIVLNDTDNLEFCLDEIVRGAMNNAGQRCTAVSRILVKRTLLADVEAGLAQRLESLKVGNGFDEAVRIGPMAMKSQFEKVMGMIAKGRADGASVVAGGQAVKPAGWETGYFIEPTLFCGVTPAMSIAREEIFGPVLSVLAYDSIDQAIDIVNGVDYGLAASIFSNDQRMVQRFIDHVEAGMVHVNHQTATDPNMPFVGVKDSGVGACSVGQSAANFYTTEYAVYLRYAA